MRMLFAALALTAPIASVPVALAGPVMLQRADAEALVRQMLDDATMSRIAARAFDQGAADTLAEAPEVQRQFAANPGLREHVQNTVRAEVVKAVVRDLPDLRAKLSALIAADLNPREIADVTTFFASPVGQKMKGAAYQSIADKPVPDQAKLQQQAIAAIMASIAPEDYPALMAFGTSSAAQKMQTLNPKITAASRTWTEAFIARHSPRMQELAAKAQADFLAGKKK